MASSELPRPPYILLFEGETRHGEPLAISVDGKSALPLFDSTTKAGAFLSSTGFGPAWEAVEVSTSELIDTLGSYRDTVDYVALNPPPATESGGMKVRMGGLDELIEALQEERREDNLFDLGKPDLN